jgi:alpha-glucosidase
MVGMSCLKFHHAIFLSLVSSALCFGQAPVRSSATDSKPHHDSIVELRQATGMRALTNGIEIKSGAAAVRITALRDDILRIQVSRDGIFPADHSWAILPEMLVLKPQVTSVAGKNAGFKTALLQVVVDSSPLRISVLDKTGRVLSSDYAARPVTFYGEQFKAYKSLPTDERIFGLGDKSGGLDRRNRSFQMWNTDAYGWEESTDPLYKALPFFLSLSKDGTSYGTFLDNTYRSSFDFGVELRDELSFGSDGGDLDYYFIYGPTPKEVLMHLADLVGRSPLPPKWALGFQQARYSYETEARVREIADTFRKKQIPVDVIYLDIDYQIKNRPFTIDPAKFPTFNQMIVDLHKEGINIIAITDLHVASLPGGDYAPYNTGAAGDHFVHNPDGSIYVGKVWPGPSVFPDFTRESTRAWWGNLYKDFYVDRGIAGFWNDMNEPSVFEVPSGTLPLDVLHRIDEPGQPKRTTTHREIHNVFGMENSRATYEGLLRLKPEQRPFVLTRATYVGGQRYAATWTGDNAATWNQLRISTPQLLNLGLSGIPFVGDDIGGFRGSPSPDLLTRWFELGAFNPIYRDHTEKSTADQEPWVHGPQQEAIRKAYIETRYQLMPYIYSLAEEASRTGLPMMRPVFLEFPKESDQHLDKLQFNSEFMFGRSLLIAPQINEALDSYVVGLPTGVWYDYWSGIRITEGMSPKVQPRLEVLPVFVRAGSIIPQQQTSQSTAETPAGALELRVYPGQDCYGTLYLDDGLTFDYQHGSYLREMFSCEVGDGALRIRIAPHEGKFQPWWTQINLRVFGAAKAPQSVTVNGAAPGSLAQFESGVVSVLVGDPQAGSDIRIQY